MKRKILPMMGVEGQNKRDVGTGVTLVPVVLDAGVVLFDREALRGQSEPERGIRFSDDPEAACEGRTVWVVWVGIRAGIDGRDGYFSAVASSLVINADRAQGFRPSSHFTDMIAAIQGSVRLDGLSSAHVKRLGEALAEHDPNLWEQRSDPLRRVWPSA